VRVENPLGETVTAGFVGAERQIIKMGKLDNQVAIVTGISFRLRCCVSGFGQFQGAAGGAERDALVGADSLIWSTFRNQRIWSRMVHWASGVVICCG